MKKEPTNYKKLFKIRCIEADMNTSEIAKLIGVSRATVSNWMNHPANVPPADMLLVLSALKYTPDEMKMIYAEMIDGVIR